MAWFDTSLTLCMLLISHLNDADPFSKTENNLQRDRRTTWQWSLSWTQDANSRLLGSRKPCITEIAHINTTSTSWDIPVHYPLFPLRRVRSAS
jgi:hypothetical protein